MEPGTLHTLELIMAVTGQTIFLVSAWGFVGAIYNQGPFAVPDPVAATLETKQTERTWIITLIATFLSVATTTFLSIAFKEALRHRMHRSILLADLNGGIALARGSFMINFHHLAPTAITLVVFGLTKLLVSSWAALLTPTFIIQTIDASGWELDITSNWFELTLENELLQSGAALVRGNSSEIIDVGGVLSGIAAAQYSFGTPGIFNFNGVQYNVSTGGVLPSAPRYNGTSQSVFNNNTGLAFAGGLVPSHLDVYFPGGISFQGLYHNYTLLQQGLTANVTCYPSNASTGNLHFSSPYQAIPIPFANGTTDYWLWAWNITANCGTGGPSQQQYVTQSNSSTAPQSLSSGFMSSLVCPYPLGQSGLPWEHFTITTNSSWKYSFLPLTVCAINPLVTTSLVTYWNGVVNSTVVTSEPLGSSNTNLTRFLAALIDHQARTTQGLTTNTIGDALFSIYVSASGNNTSSGDEVTELLLEELALYWRGVIEFAGTFLRSAFSVYPRTVPVEAQIDLNGTENIMTMGWSSRPELFGYLVPITIVALIMYAAVAYTLWHVFIEQLPGHKSFTKFDPSNPIHVMMVSSARGNAMGMDSGNLDHLEDRLAGFEKGGVAQNDCLSVRLIDVLDDRHERKRLGVARERAEKV